MIDNNPSSSQSVNSPLDFLQQCIDRIWAEAFDLTITQFAPIATFFSPTELAQINKAGQTVKGQKQSFSPELEASLELIQGRESYGSNQIDKAIKHYEKSLGFWSKQVSDLRRQSDTSPTLPYYARRQAVLLFYLGLCYYQLALGEPETEKARPKWEKANDYFQQCLDLCEQDKYDDLASKFVTKKCEVLQKLEAWIELQALAKNAVGLHINHGTEEQLAQDYGFLAESALKNSRWVHASQLAELALAIQTQVRIDEPQTSSSSYLYLLTESQEQLSQWQDTVNQLQAALKKTNPQQDLSGYLNILRALKKLYFDQGQYRQAAQYKEEFLRTKYQYGLHPFIGVNQLQSKQSGTQSTNVASEILASGRMHDVSNLMGRIKSEYQKLIILHGESGAGKSSLINAGLVPVLLQPEESNDLIILPIVLRVFTDWLRDPNPETWNLTTVLRNLREKSATNTLKLLIFDQFEEFFVVCQQLTQRLPFYEFLRECLSLGSVKVMLVMRTEFLHYLLECDRFVQLGALQIDILSKNVLYYLGNFSTANTKSLLRNLSEQSQFNLEHALINQVIKDLTIPLAEVRPVELQLVGVQMQNEGVNTLAKYHSLGSEPVIKLMERFLDDTIQDCGEEHSKTARLVLYSLTSEKDIRVLKTRNQIADDLLSDNEKLDLVLEVLVRSGLVLQIPEIPDDRYQLAHTYLAELIRQQGGLMRIAELELEREKLQRKLSEEKPNSFVDRAIASVFRWLRSD